MRLIRIFTLSPALVGCVVSQGRFERSQSALEAEHTAHEETALDLLESEKALARARLEQSSLEAQARDEQARLLATQGREAQSELDYERLGKVCDEQGMLAQQTASRAALLNRQLEESETERSRLALLEADLASTAHLLRDLALQLHTAVSERGVSIDLHQAKARVLLPRAGLFSPGETELSDQGMTWTALIAKVASGYPLQSVELRAEPWKHPSATDAEGPALAEPARLAAEGPTLGALQTAKDALVDRGIGADVRFTLVGDDEAASDPGEPFAGEVPERGEVPEGTASEGVVRPPDAASMIAVTFTLRSRSQTASSGVDTPETADSEIGL